jgi:hypothetical protein
VVGKRHRRSAEAGALTVGPDVRMHHVLGSLELVWVVARDEEHVTVIDGRGAPAAGGNQGNSDSALM